MDPLNLILLIVVVLVGLKLRSVLGFRNDDEKPSSRSSAYRLNRDAFENKPEGKENNQPAALRDPDDSSQDGGLQDNGSQDNGLQEAAQPLQGQPVAASLEPVSQDDDTAGRGLAYLRRVQPDFDEGNFVEGAARAYEMILTAFADGDISGVKGFLGAEVAAGFDAAMDQRQAQGQQLITRVLRLDRPVLEDARFENDKVQLDVRFRAELISFTTGLDETVDEAALPAPNTTLDVWTFEGAQGVADSSWALVATQSA